MLQQRDPAETFSDLRDVGRRAVRGGLSLGLRQGIAAAIGVIAGVVLARRLEPAMFGAYAVVTFVVRLFAWVCDVGIGAALVRKPRVDERDLSTAFVLQQAFTVLAAATVAASAGLWERAYGIPGSAAMLRTLAVGLWVSSLGTIPSLVLERTLRFERIAAADLLSAFVYHGLAVVLAFRGFGAWSFVLAALARSGASAAALNGLSPWRPSLRFSRDRARELVSFGVPFQANRLLVLLKDNVTPTLIAMAAGAGAVGYVNWAQGLAYLPLLAMPVLGQVAFPTFSRLQHDREKLRRGVETTLRLLALGIYPATALLAALAPEIVRHVYTDRWRPALPSVYLFSVATAWSVVSYPAWNALLALGRAGTCLRLAAIWTAAEWGLAVPLVFAFGHTGFAIAIALVAQSAILAVRELRRDLAFEIASRIRLPLACAAVSAAATRLAAGSAVSGPATLLLVAAGGAILYAVLVAILGGRELLEELRPILQLLPGRQFAEDPLRWLRRRARRAAEGLHARFYHDAERLAHIGAMVRTIAPRRSLEVGAGPGRLPSVDTPGTIVLTDREFKLVRRQRRLWAGCGRPVHFVVADARSLPFRDGAFDHVAVLDVLEHVPEQRQAAAEIERVLAPGGSVVFFGPAENWRFPYHRWLRPFALSEDEVLKTWGHFIRGYRLADLAGLFPACRPVEIVRYHEGAYAFRVDVEFTRLPFLLKIPLWAVGEVAFGLLRLVRRPGEPICFGVRLRKEVGG
jgi:O-antigen/teichoic acid export membrane protein